MKIGSLSAREVARVITSYSIHYTKLYDLDVGHTADDMYIHRVRELTDEYRRGGRVVAGHMAKLSLLPPAELAALAKSLADSGVAVTVLPATDLFLMGRDQDYNVRRGVADAIV